MNLSNRHRLAGLTRNLLSEWERTRELWRDDRAEEFERTYLKDLESSVNRAVHSMEKLDAIMAKVRKDCE